MRIPSSRAQVDVALDAARCRRTADIAQHNTETADHAEKKAIAALLTHKSERLELRINLKAALLTTYY